MHMDHDIHKWKLNHFKKERKVIDGQEFQQNAGKEYSSLI